LTRESLIIDFCIQPPYRSFLDIYFYRPRPATPDLRTVTQYELGRRESSSFCERSIERFVEEMDTVGIDVAVIMGQRSGPTSVRCRGRGYERPTSAARLRLRRERYGRGDGGSGKYDSANL